MKEAMRTEHYRKDMTTEECLRRANGLLASLDARVAGGAGPGLPVVFIVGAPQSATTLVSQIFAHAACFGYVSNFVARFYAAPALGLLLQRALGIGGDESGSFSSEYGVTQGWSSPHEFGYFWDRWFDFGQEVHKLSPELLARVDRAGLRSAIGGMESVAGGPMVFKNNTWCTFQIAFLREVFPRTVWVVCQRHPLYNAQSIAVGRMRRYGDINAWWSMRPPRYPELRLLPWWEQVVGQLRGIVDDMEDGLRSVDPADVVRVRYEDLCRDPGRLLAAVTEIFRRYGIALSPRTPAAPFTCRDIRTLPEQEWGLLRRACVKWFGGGYAGWSMED